MTGLQNYQKFKFNLFPCHRYLVYCCIFFALTLTPSAAKSQVTDTVKVMIKAVGTDISSKQKLKYLYKICAAYWYVNIDSAFYYGREGLSLVHDKVDPVDVGKLYFTLAQTWNNQGNLDSSLWYFNQARNIFKLHSLDKMYYRSVEQIGCTYRVIGKYDTARILILKALDYYRNSNDTLQLSSALFNLGTTWLDQNRYTRALQFFLQAVAFDSVIKDTSTIALNSLGIGNVYLNLGSLFKEINPAKSTAYFNQSIKYFQRSNLLFTRIGHTMGTCYALMNLQSAYLNSGMISKVDSVFQYVGPCFEAHNSRLTMNLFYYEAAVEASKGNKTEALRLLDTVAGMKSQMLLLNEFYEAMMLRSTLIYETRQTEQAFSQMNEVIDWARAHRVYQLAYPALKTLASWQAEHGEHGVAYRLLAMAQMYKDSLYNEVSNELFDEVEVRYKKEALADELASLRSEHKIKFLRNLIIFLILGSLILIILGVMIILLYRRKQLLANQQTAQEKILRMEKEALYSQSELERLNLERILHREEADRLQVNLQLKEQEIIFQSLRQTDLKQLNLSVKDKLGPFQYRLPKKKDQDEFSSLMNEISRNASKDPMDEFEILFRQMHGGFYEKLLERCPDLTQSQLRTCALLRLNLSTKEIARLHNLSSASVDTTRHHIRQKLNLDPKDTLTSFLIMV